MPQFAANEDVRIHYEVEGRGTPIVLHHGLSQDLQSWRNLGYVHDSENDFQLILVDARGHGQSDKPHTPEDYALIAMARDVLAVMDDLGIQVAHYWGYSMGGNVGFALMEAAPERFGTFVLGGVSPFRGREERADIAPLFDALREGGMEGFIAAHERLRGRLPRALLARLRASDPQALLAAYERHLSEPGCTRLLPGIENPCLLYAGDRDPRHEGARAGAALLPNGEFLSLPRLDHFEAPAWRDLILPRVKEFLK